MRITVGRLRSLIREAIESDSAEKKVSSDPAASAWAAMMKKKKDKSARENLAGKWNEVKAAVRDAKKSKDADPEDVIKDLSKELRFSSSEELEALKDTVESMWDAGGSSISGDDLISATSSDDEKSDNPAVRKVAGDQAASAFAKLMSGKSEGERQAMAQAWEDSQSQVDLARRRDPEAMEPDEYAQMLVKKISAFRGVDPQALADVMTTLWDQRGSVVKMDHLMKATEKSK